MILNSFAIQLNDEAVKICLPRHQEWAMKIFENIKADLISDFIKHFSLQDIVTDALLLDIAKK